MGMPDVQGDGANRVRYLSRQRVSRQGVVVRHHSWAERLDQLPDVWWNLPRLPRRPHHRSRSGRVRGVGGELLFGLLVSSAGIDRDRLDTLRRKASQ